MSNFLPRGIAAALASTLVLGSLALSCKGRGASSGEASSPASVEVPSGVERSAFLLARGQKFLAQGQNEEAAKVLELAQQADSTSPRIKMALARAYLGSKQPQKAQAILQALLASPDTPIEDKGPAREMLVELLLNKGDLAGAESACAPLLEGERISATARRLSGMIAYQKGDPESLKRAVSELKDAVRIAPSDAKAQTALGLALLKTNDLAGAASALEQAERLDPNSDAAVSNLAKVYELQGRKTEAEEARKRFQAIYDRRSLRQKVGPLRAKGVDAFNEGHLDEALKDFQEVLKASPDDPQALAQLGSVYLVMQNLDEAEKYLKQALALRPDDDFALTEMGRVRALRNDLPGAIQLLQKAIRSNPDAPEPHYFLAGIYYAQQRREDFIREKEAFDKLRKTTPVSGVMELPEAPPGSPGS